MAILCLAKDLEDLKERFGRIVIGCNLAGDPVYVPVSYTHLDVYKRQDQYVVVKYGGNAMVDEELKKSVMKDLLLLQLVGVKVVLVHGGGPAINSTLEAMQIEDVYKRQE